jgi:hypothetical protein
MSKRSKKQKNRSRKEPRPQLPAPQLPTTKTWKWLSWLSPKSGILTGFALLLAIVTFYYTFSSKLEVGTDASLNPNDPFATPFVVKNHSLLSVGSLKQSCFLNFVLGAHGGVARNFTTRWDDLPIPNLEPLEETTFGCAYPFIFLGPISYADIQVCISYRPALVPLRQEKRTRFITVRGKDGILRWVKIALSASVPFPVRN